MIVENGEYCEGVVFIAPFTASTSIDACPVDARHLCNGTSACHEEMAMPCTAILIADAAWQKSSMRRTDFLWFCFGFAAILLSTNFYIPRFYRNQSNKTHLALAPASCKYSTSIEATMKF
jgi:hypothetical protein